VELWFLSQGHNEHLEKEDCIGSAETNTQWKKLDFSCVVKWQSVNPHILRAMRTFKTCSFLKRAQSIFARAIYNVYTTQQRN